MSIPARAIAGICVGMLILMMSVSPAPGLTIHPAVLKNFVGPFRKPGEPMLKPTFFDRPRVVGQRLVGRAGGQDVSGISGRQQDLIYSRQMADKSGVAGAVVEGQESVYPAAVRGPPLSEEWNRPLRSCKGSGSCAQNMDNTLNLLMRMMETGKR